MANLQQESDLAFKEVSSTTLAEQIEAANAVRPPKEIQYADEEGADDYPAPAPLEDDGKGFKRSAESVDFADGRNPTEFDSTPPEPIGQGPTRQPRSLEDIHAADATPSPSRDDFDQRLLARAKSYGLTDAQIRSTYRSREQLEGALLAIDQQGLNQFRWWRQQQQQPQQFVQQPAAPVVPQQAPQQPQVPATPQAELLEEYKLQNPELYDETLVSDLNGLSKFTLDKIKKQSERLQQLEAIVVAQQQREQQRQQEQQQALERQEFNDFDEAIRSLGEDFEDVFGSEPAEELLPNDPRKINRARAWQAAKELQVFHFSTRGRYVSPTDVLPSSVQLNFPERQQAAGTKPRRGRPGAPRDPRSGRYLAVPSGRNRPAQRNTREEMLRRADRFFQSRGMPGDQDFSYEDEGI